MWGKSRTSERIGEELPPPFPAWVVELDTNLGDAESNGIYQAFWCRRAYHSRSLRSFFSLRSVQAPRLATILLCVVLCWPMAFVLIAMGLLARGLGARLNQPLGADQRASLPERINFLIQRHGIMVPECMDLWMAGMNGQDFSKALYAELREGTGRQARFVQVLLSLALPGIYVAVLWMMGQPYQVLSPFFWLFLATSAWLVLQIGPYGVLAGMTAVADEIDTRRRMLTRVATKRSFWEFDPDIMEQLKRLAKGVAGTVVALFALYIATCSFGTVHDFWNQSPNPILRNAATHSAGLATAMLITLFNLWMRYRLKHRERWVAEIASSLQRAGEAFELVLVVNSGSGPEEISHWMAARQAAGKVPWAHRDSN